MKDEKCVERYKSGLLGEEQAIEYFERQGFVLLARRFKTKNGEIDAIFSNDKLKLLVFVEVKRRKEVYDYDKVISKNQWNRIYSASIDFIEQVSPKYDDYKIRYDAFICFLNTNNFFHIENILTNDNVLN